MVPTWQSRVGGSGLLKGWVRLAWRERDSIVNKVLNKLIARRAPVLHHPCRSRLSGQVVACTGIFTFSPRSSELAAVRGCTGKSTGEIGDPR